MDNNWKKRHLRMLTLPETITKTLFSIFVNWCFNSPWKQSRDCAIISGSVSMLTMSSIIIHASYSIPILSPFLFIPSLYAILFVIRRIFISSKLGGNQPRQLGVGDCVRIQCPIVTHTSTILSPSFSHMR